MLSSLSLRAQADDNAPLPRDPKVVIGKLPNGITYYLRHNEVPKGQACFYIVRNAGSLMEEEGEEGLAHFLEHMAFQGTENFPGRGVVDMLERHGVLYGHDINAVTSENETTYTINGVPTHDKKLLDSCMMVMRDWSYYLTLDADEIDEERAVITEEYHTRNTPQDRIQDQISEVIFRGSKYAGRSVIGELDVIQNFKPEALREFYHRWYRTDLEAIVVVGDFDIKKMEQKIKDVFSSIPAVENPTPRPFFDIPSHEETYFCLATDKEATSSNVQVVRIFREKEYDGKGYTTYEDIKNSLLISFYKSMISARIGELVQSGKAPYVSASVGLYGVARGYYGYYIMATAKPNEEAAALRGALEAHEQVYQHGFTDSELERVKTNFLTMLESAVKDKDKTSNDSYAKEMQSHFLENEGIVDITDYAAAVKEILPTITAEEVAAQARRWWKADNRTIIVSGPSEGATHLTEQEARAIVDEMEKTTVAAYEDNHVEGKLIENEPQGGSITAVKELPQFGAEEWTLSNGAKVIYRKADFEKDAVSLMAYSPGGTSLYTDIDFLPAASSAGDFASSYGLGDYSDVQLDKLLTGKRASCKVDISTLYETVGGSSTPKDFETMMQLLYLRFTAPRFDTLTHKVLIERNHIYAKLLAGQPQTVIRDSMSRIVSNYSPRLQLFNDEYVDKLTIDRIEKAYRDRICDASDFTFFIVGNIGKDTAKAMTEKYIGAIPSLYRHEKWVDRNVRGPKGRTEKVINVPMETPKSTVAVIFNKEMKYDLKDAYTISILGNILTTRYTKTIREEAGGTYGVGVSGSASREPYNSYSMYMTFECDPEKATELKPLLYKEVDNILEEGVTQEELDKVVKNTLKELEQSKPHNSYWMTVLYNYYRTGVDSNDPKNRENLISSITTKDVQAFAKKFFKKADVIDLIFAGCKKEEQTK